MKAVNANEACDIDAIQHKGIIKRQDDNTVYVAIIAQTACDACHAKGICNVTDLREEVIEVPRMQGKNYNIGEHVEVVMKKALGTRAVFLGYVLPFLIVLGTLIGTLAVTGNEGLAGVVAVAILVPYYIILSLQKRRLKQTFTFNIR